MLQTVLNKVKEIGSMVYPLKKRISLYTLFVAALLILRLFFWFSPAHEAKLELSWLWPAGIAALAIAICLRRTNPPAGMWLVVCLTLWFWTVTVLNGDYALALNGHFIVGVTIGIGVCFLTVPMMKQSNREQELVFIIKLYVALMVCMALMSLLITVFETSIQTPLSSQPWGIREGRLYVFDYHPNEVGCAFTVALLLTLALIPRARSTWGRILLALIVVTLYAAITLTVCRTSMILTSLGLGALFTLLPMKRLARMKRLPRFCLHAALFVVTVSLAFFGFTPFSKIVTNFHGAAAFATEDTSLVQPTPVALSEEALAQDKPPMLLERDLGHDFGTFTGRTELWGTGLSYLKERPKTLLIGSTDAEVSRIPRRYAQRVEYHLHNLWLELLVQIGLPGILLYALLMLMTLRAGLKLWLVPNTPLWIRFLPVVFVVLCINGAMEIYPGITGNIMDMMFFILCGAIITFGKAASDSLPLSQKHLKAHP
ncbi:MAG: O-antigen ligase family protein [Eubacteriales bacterium]|nr:O-antigen ligase family protein [Eubacteriales bacterium]